MMSKFMKPAAAALALSLTWGCSKAPGLLEGVTVPQSAPAEVRETVERSWPKVLAACPGLGTYAADLSFKGVDDNFAYAPREAQRIDVRYQVKEQPSSIPPAYAASGHTCNFGISRDGKLLDTGKSACASICKGAQQPTSLLLPLV